MADERDTRIADLINEIEDPAVRRAMTLMYEEMHETHVIDLHADFGRASQVGKAVHDALEQARREGMIPPEVA